MLKEIEENNFASKLESFIDENEIWSCLEKAQNPDPVWIKDVLEKATACEGLSLLEAAALISNNNPETDEALFAAAMEVKQKIYGNRIVFFAPLYVTNECSNACSYCGFSVRNKELERRTLSSEEIAQEVKILEDMGHKRILAVYGEHPRFGPEWIARTVEDIYAVRSGKSGEIRRVNINAAPMTVEGFAIVKKSGIGTYQCFQETYHRQTYEKIHLGGKKRDFLWRLYALHRAQEGGIDDVATGPLYGLFDYRFELLATLAHARRLEEDFGVGPHTLSFPRIEPALGSEISNKPPYAVDDATFKKIVAITRLAVPYTGLILSTRENPQLRRELLQVGVSQMSAASRVYPKAYQTEEVNRVDSQQFKVCDDRSLDDVIRDVVENLGYIPSFCTSCYRQGRTGDHFMGLAKKAFINNYCQPNALLTFAEYLHDYASKELKESGFKLIDSELGKIKEPGKMEIVKKRLQEIADGTRDIYW